MRYPIFLFGFQIDDPFYAAVAHFQFTVGHLCQGFVVGDYDERLPVLLPQIEKQVVELVGIAAVQVTGRFVGKYHRRTVYQCACYGYALLFPWTEAICMGKQYPSRERFLALPLDTKLGIYREVLAFHSHVAKRGYVSVDFYDGCVLFEEATGRTLLCDVDAYHKIPFFNPVGRMWGSTRFMAPEEFEKGAAIDESTMVHTLGAFAFELFAPEGRELAQWPLSPAAWACAKKAASPKREDRFSDVASYIRGWEDAIGTLPALR